MRHDLNKKASLDSTIASLKKEEARYRYLVTGTKTSPEFRREALSKLQETRKRLYELSGELRTLDDAAK